MSGGYVRQSTTTRLQSDEKGIPTFNVGAVFSPRNLLNDAGPIGAAFEGKYMQELNAVPEASRGQPHEGAIFPGYLVGNDSVTFRTGRPGYNYTVVSYTWGRWMNADRTLDTPVRGGHWKVPANTLFTRAELDSAVRNIAGDSNMWVDVLCIPQDDGDPEKAAEIGKQGDIFRSASRAAIWLCSGGDEVLVELCSAVPEQSYLTPPEVIPELVVEARRRLRMVADLPRLVPWLTSLWTLQESALRVDAVFYDKQGLPLRHTETGNPIDIRHLIRTIQEIEDDLCNLEEQVSAGHIWSPGYTRRSKEYVLAQEDIPLLREARRAVERIGLLELVNMNAVQLLRAAAQRECQRPHDRVYGIMGAIGVPVPVDYGEDPSRVMDDFILELHRRIPAEMQCFHRPSGRSSGERKRDWMVDDESTVFGLVRQLAPPPRNVFASITTEGHLVITNALSLAEQGVEELISRALVQGVLSSFDNDAVAQIFEGDRSPASFGSVDYVEFCRFILELHTRTKLNLVPLGTLRGMAHLGWKFSYALVGMTGTHPVAGDEMYRRLGILFTGDELVLSKPRKGQILLQ